MGGEFVSVMNTWQEANSVFDRVLGETYGPFASPTPSDEAAALLATSRLTGQLLAANDAPRERIVVFLKSPPLCYDPGCM